MIRTTIIARASDGHPLAASMDDDEIEMRDYKNQAKEVFKRLSLEPQGEPRCTIDANQYVYQYACGICRGGLPISYLVESNVCYMTLCDKTYPRRLAFSYLEELQKEFQANFGSEVAAAVRPYCFVKFDTFIQKTKKNYKNSQTQRNLAKLNEDLHDVTRIMTKNIEDVLGRQDALNKMSEMSNQLMTDSSKYLKNTKYLNLQALYRKYGPPVVVFLVVLVVIYVRFYW